MSAHPPVWLAKRCKYKIIFGTDEIIAVYFYLCGGTYPTGVGYLQNTLYMKTLASVLIASAVALSLSACGSGEQKNEGPATVYMTRQITPEGLVRIYESLGVPAHGKVAVKISTGEPGGHNYLKPELIADLVREVEGTIVECNTAYAGRRYTSEEHWQAIREHGFTAIAPVDLMDEEGEFKIEVKDTTHLKYNLVGTHLTNYDYMINLAHFKGHAMGGFGGVLKNQSIGVASANGKAYIHTAGRTDRKETMWEGISQVPQDHFLESMAAAAQAVHDYFGEGNIIYINVMNNLSVDCDCDSHPHDPQMKDIGILASTDPVALDQACLDLVFNYPSSEDDNAEPLIERINTRHGVHTVEYAETIGLGTRSYNIVEIDD